MKKLIMIAIAVNLSLCAVAQAGMPDMSGWPVASQMAAKEMISKYGAPAESTPTMLIWYNNGPWAKTVIYNQEYKHDFPKPHTDVIQQWVALGGSGAKIDNLYKFDGSIVVERTTGMISARCDNEAANFLALNLAYDIIQGKTSATLARDYYTRAIRDLDAGKTDPYMSKLNFTPDTKSPDPDQPTIK